MDAVGWLTCICPYLHGREQEKEKSESKRERERRDRKRRGMKMLEKEEAEESEKICLLGFRFILCTFYIRILRSPPVSSVLSKVRWVLSIHKPWRKMNIGHLQAQDWLTSLLWPCVWLICDHRKEYNVMTTNVLTDHLLSNYINLTQTPVYAWRSASHYLSIWSLFLRAQSFVVPIFLFLHLNSPPPRLD